MVRVQMVLDGYTSFITSFLFNDPPTTALYTLSLHDALPIYPRRTSAGVSNVRGVSRLTSGRSVAGETRRDRKSTRLNSSHITISYAVFCLKKKRKSIDMRWIPSQLVDDTNSSSSYRCVRPVL